MTTTSDRVIVTWPSLVPEARAILEGAGLRVECVTDSNDTEALRELVAREPVAAIFSRTMDLDGELLRSAQGLRTIGKHGVGTNNIDVEAATELGVLVSRATGANSTSVAEHTIGLMLAAARRTTWLDAEVKAGRWSRIQDGVQLQGRTLGLVGLGQIGRQVATIARAIGMEVAFFDPMVSAADAPAELTRAESLEDLLRIANVLSLHVPLNDHTRGMIGRAQLESLPAGAIVVNASRGPVLDEDALAELLDSGHLAGAGLDTLTEEPVNPEARILRSDRAVITPHVGGSTPDSLRRVGTMTAQHIVDVLTGTELHPSVIVNPAVLTGETNA